MLWLGGHHVNADSADGCRGERPYTRGVIAVQWHGGCWMNRMALSGDERELVADLIGSVRTLAAHVITLHLQLGAVRTLLARKGTISDAEVQAAFAELNVLASTEETLSLTSADAVFDALLERLNRGA
jgi:hypothetical protein